MKYLLDLDPRLLPFSPARLTDIQGYPIEGALLDVWQANDEGFYDVQQKDIQPAFNLRGIFETDHDGKFWFRTAKPRWYPIPHDGPVGHLLDALGRQPNRPAHLHFIVTASNFQSVTTHIFAPDCPYLEEDAVFGVKRSLIAKFKETNDAERAVEFGVSSPFWEVEWNFKLVSTNGE